MSYKTDTNFNLDDLIEHIAPQFTPNTTIRTMAIYLLTNRPDLTHDQMATIVVGIKHKYGQMANTSGSSIAWYKQDMKKKGGNEEIKSIFTNYLQTLEPEKRNEILVQLGDKYVDILIKAADVDTIAKFVPIKDTPEVKPVAAQITAAREAEPEKAEIAELPKVKKLIRKKG